MRVDPDPARYAPEHVKLTVEDPDLEFARA